MPMLIEYIDAIARQKQRDVLSIEFHPENCNRFGYSGNYSFQDDPVRQKVLDDLTEMGISFMPCGRVANEEFMGGAYLGQVYVDVPFDKTLPLYQKLEVYLEHPDGSMRFETVRFYVLKLETAMKNAHHDEPDFWEKWAEDF